MNGYKFKAKLLLAHYSHFQPALKEARIFSACFENCKAMKKKELATNVATEYKIFSKVSSVDDAEYMETVFVTVKRQLSAHKLFL